MAARLVLANSQDIRDALNEDTDNESVTEADQDEVSIIEPADQANQNQVIPDTSQEVIQTFEISDSGTVTLDINDLLSGTTSLENRCTGRPAKRHKGIRGGRPPDEVRLKFDIQSTGKAKCKKCSKCVTNRVDVMKSHNDVCKGEFPRKKDQNIRTSGISTVAVASDTLKGPTSSKRLSEEPTSAAKSFKLEHFLDRTSSQEQSKISRQVGKMVYACNLSFRFVDNPEVIKTFKMLRPSFKLPTRSELGNAILDDVYEEIRSDFIDSVSGKEVTLLQDGWSTKQLKPVIAHSTHSGNRTYFLNSIYTGTNEKTANYCLKLLLDAIVEVEGKHRAIVIGICTDNCNTMLSLREKVAAAKPGLFVYGCNAHYFNTVGRKLISIDEMKDIVSIQKFFKSHHYQSAALDIEDGRRPVLPGATRWNSQIDCIENYLLNHTKYLNILRKNPQKFDKKIADLIKSSTLYNNAQSLRNRAKPLAVSLDKIQGNSSTLADAVNAWMELRCTLKFSTPLQKSYFDEKLKEAISGPGTASYMLDPRYRGRGLQANEEAAGLKWLEDIDMELGTLSLELEAGNEELFPAHLLQEERLQQLRPSSFWKLIEKANTVRPELCRICRRLNQLPASSSSIERSFSVMSSIMTKQRNRLGVEKAAKLCTISQSLPLLKDESEDELDL